MEDYKIYNIIGFIEGRIASLDETDSSDCNRIAEAKKILNQIRRVYNI